MTKKKKRRYEPRGFDGRSSTQPRSNASMGILDLKHIERVLCVGHVR
jgi:hypothetical protein